MQLKAVTLWQRNVTWFRKIVKYWSEDQQHVDGKIICVELVNKIRLEIRERSCTGSTHKVEQKKSGVSSIHHDPIPESRRRLNPSPHSRLPRQELWDLFIHRQGSWFLLCLLSSSNFLAQNASTFNPSRDCTISKIILKHKCTCLYKRSGFHLCSVPKYVFISTPRRDNKISKFWYNVRMLYSFYIMLCTIKC